MFCSKRLCILSFLIATTGCLETDGNLQSSGSLGSNVSSVSADEIGSGTLPLDVLIGSVAQMPAPMDGSSCSASQILEWNGSDWFCVNTPSSSGNPGADTVDSSAIVDGSIIGNDIQNNSINANTKLSTTCADNEVLQASGGVFVCASSSSGLGDHTATQNVELNGNWLSGDGGNEGVFVDANGLVGIGTQTPTKNLHVVSSTGNPAFFETIGSNNTAQAGLAVLKTVTGGAAGANGIGAGMYFRTVDTTGTQNNVGGVVGVYDDADPATYARRLVLRAGGQTISQIANGEDGLHILDTNTVGIGTSTPSKRLHVVEVDANPAFFEHSRTDNNTVRAGLTVVRTVAGGGAGANGMGSGIHFRAVDSSGTERNIGGILSVFDDANTASLDRRIVIKAGGQTLNQIANQNLGVHIVESGDVGIGVSNPSHTLQVNGVARSTQSTWATSSDERVKDNIETIENGLDYISKLRPVTFNYKAEYALGKSGLQKKQYGFIAQEVKPVVNEAVDIITEKFGDEEITDFHILDTSSFMALVISAIQSITDMVYDNDQRYSKMVDELIKENSDLKRMNDDLNKRMLRLEAKFDKL